MQQCHCPNPPAFRWAVSVSNLQAAAQGDQLLMLFHDILGLGVPHDLVERSLCVVGVPDWLISRVGQNCTYTPYMTVYLYIW